MKPLASLFDLTGRVALVTGGSRGLGLEFAHHGLAEAGCIGRPGELQGVGVFLAADASNFITGQNIVVDGGRTSV